MQISRWLLLFCSDGREEICRQQAFFFDLRKHTSSFIFRTKYELGNFSHSQGQAIHYSQGFKIFSQSCVRVRFQLKLEQVGPSALYLRGLPAETLEPWRSKIILARPTGGSRSLGYLGFQFTTNVARYARKNQTVNEVFKQCAVADNFCSFHN